MPFPPLPVGPMLVLEVIAAVLGVLCVGLLITRNHWSWPIGLVQVVLQGIVFWDAKLYAETGLQVVFAVLQLYGWWAWLVSRRGLTGSAPGGVAQEQIRVETLTARGWGVSIGSTMLGTLAVGWFLARYTDGQSPWLDAFIAAASLTAQYLLAARCHENWTFWIIVDVVSIPLFIARGLYPFAILYVVFLGLAIAGWITWRRVLRLQIERGRTSE